MDQFEFIRRYCERPQNFAWFLGAGASKDIGEQAAKTDPCPICKKPGVKIYEPFCSTLTPMWKPRWLSGGYGIPVTEEDDSAGEG